MWLYQAGPGYRLIEWHPEHAQVSAPAIEQDTDDTARVTWFVERGGQTGFVDVYRAVFFITGRQADLR